MRVTNIRWTDHANCKCGNWLAHWERFAGRAAFFCAERSCCVSFGLVGVHVQIAGTSDGPWYIVPLCAKHIANGVALDISDGVKPVPANIRETCS
jgi:hypothetical protein